VGDTERFWNVRGGGLTDVIIEHILNTISQESPGLAGKMAAIAKPNRSIEDFYHPRSIHEAPGFTR
jgi:hypothetical protein